jgi:nucleoside-diphosphate-sugar epimerase
MTRKILVTGSSGFLGTALVEQLAGMPDIHIVAVSRRATAHPASNVTTAAIATLNTDTQWGPVLHDVDTVVHTAARVHVMHDTAADPLALYREVNTLGTLELAQQAASAGVRRFIFISTIKVNGESTERDQWTSGPGENRCDGRRDHPPGAGLRSPRESQFPAPYAHAA